MIRQSFMFLMIIVLTLICIDTSWSQWPKEEPGNPQMGSKLFIEKRCIHCHSVSGMDQKTRPRLASVGMGRNLYELCASIWSHWMQINVARKQQEQAPIVLSSNEIRDIITYLYYLNYYKEPGEQLLGEKIFLDRGCSQCHASEPVSAGAKVGPSLYEMRDFKGPINLAVALWNHGERMLLTLSQKGIPWPQLEAKEVADLVSYIRGQTEQEVEAAPLPGDPLRGRELFASRSCAGCHGTRLGHMGIGPNLAASGAGARLSSLVAGLWNHYPKMVQAMSLRGIPRARMTTSDMEDLMAYVYWMKAYGLEGNPVSGREVYNSKQCAACHSQVGNGQPPAPPLVGSETTKSPYALLAAIWNHGPKMESRLQQKKMVWPTLTGDEMRNLIAFFQATPQVSR